MNAIEMLGIAISVFSMIVVTIGLVLAWKKNVAEYSRTRIEMALKEEHRTTNIEGSLTEIKNDVKEVKSKVRNLDSAISSMVSNYAGQTGVFRERLANHDRDIQEMKGS